MPDKNHHTKMRSSGARRRSAKPLETRKISGIAKEAIALLADRHQAEATQLADRHQAEMNQLAQRVLADMGLSHTEGWYVHVGDGLALRPKPGQPT